MHGDDAALGVTCEVADHAQLRNLVDQTVAWAGRIDIVVKTLHFNTRFLGELLARIEEGFNPETAVPSQIVFTEAEIERLAHSELRSVNGQIEYVLRDALRRAGRIAPRDPPPEGDRPTDGP